MIFIEIAGSRTSGTDKSTPSLEEIVLEEDSFDLESFLADEQFGTPEAGEEPDIEGDTNTSTESSKVRNTNMKKSNDSSTKPG